MQLSSAVCDWIERAGYKGDLSAVAAGLYDVTEAVDKIRNEMVPILEKLDWRNAKQLDRALDILYDLHFEFKHIRDHCEAADEPLFGVMRFVEEKLEAQKNQG